MKDYTDELYQEEARVEAIYPLALMGDPERIPAWLEDFVDYHDEPSRPIFEALPELVALIDVQDPHLWAEALQRCTRRGLIIRYEVMIRAYRGASGAYFSGWGRVRYGYLYAEEIDDVGPAVLAVARRQHDQERLKGAS